MSDTDHEKYSPLIVEEDIGTIRYVSKKFPATPSLKLLSRTATILGDQGLRLVIAQHVKGLSLPRARFVQQLPYVALQLAEGLGEDPNLPRDLCANLKASRVLPTDEAGVLSGAAFDRHFTGELPHLLEVLTFVLSHNFAGFTLGGPSLSGRPTSDETSEETQSD